MMLLEGLKVASNSDFLGYSVLQADFDGLTDRISLLRALEINYALSGSQEDFDAVSTTLTRLERSLLQCFRSLTTLGHCSTASTWLNRLDSTSYSPFDPPCVCENRRVLRRRLSPGEDDNAPAGAAGGGPVAAGPPSAGLCPPNPLAGTNWIEIQKDITDEEEVELEEELEEEELELEIKTETQ